MAYTTLAPSWKTVNKTYFDFLIAWPTNDIEIYSLAPKEALRAIILKTSKLFTCGTVGTCTISTGISGALSLFTTAFDVKQAVSDTTIKMSSVLGIQLFNIGSAASLGAAAISTIGNLNAATQGSVNFWLLTSFIQ